MTKAVQVNRRRQQPCSHGACASGIRWLVECRDLRDSADDDADVYFVPCREEAQVDAMLAEMTDSNTDNRYSASAMCWRP